MYSDGTTWGVSVQRGFAYPAGGNGIHFRTAGDPALPVLLCLHPSPVSAAGIVPLVSELGRHFHVLAPDTLGNGNSRGSIPDNADISFFAEAVEGFLGEMNVSSCPIYGCHTGASIGIEIARRGKVEVPKLILDGVGIYSEDFRDRLYANYTPRIELDDAGLYVHRLWTMLRDMYLFWPWFEKGAKNRRPIDLPSPEAMHWRFVEVLKAATTYGRSYQAAFHYDKLAALKSLTQPVLITSVAGDMLSEMDRLVLEALPDGRHAANAGFATAKSTRATAGMFREFLKEP